MNINELIDGYYEAREVYEHAKRLASEMEKKRRVAENELINAMLNEGMPSIGRDDGTKVGLRRSVTISCTKENVDATRAWLIETTGDDTDYVEEVVSKPTLVELVKKKVEEGADETDFPEFLRVNTRPTLSVLGWSKRQA